jgi:triacylglycerol lipase
MALVVLVVGLLVALVAALLLTAWRARRADTPHAHRDEAGGGVDAPARRDDSAPDRPPAPTPEPESAAPEVPVAPSWRPLRRAAPRAHPIVLAHGFMGFGTIGVPGFRQDYFRGVAARLRKLGVEVYATRVAPVAGIEARADQLARQIRALGAERVNVIAHSMGGLDARVAIAEMGVADRVASLVTIGTPHHGTPLADGGASLLGGLRRLGVELAALDDLRTERMAELNRRVHDARGVVYLSYVGITAPHSANVLLRPSVQFLERRAGPNDGLVPASSQRWGRVLGDIDADHWAQIGWSTQFDAGQFYEAVILRLRGLGL